MLASQQVVTGSTRGKTIVISVYRENEIQDARKRLPAAKYEMLATPGDPNDILDIRTKKTLENFLLQNHATKLNGHRYDISKDFYTYCCNKLSGAKCFKVFIMGSIV